MTPTLMRAEGAMDQAEDARRTASPEPGFDTARAFDEHGAVLLGFAVSALRDRTLAEDCVQETFLRAWRARARFDAERGSERTWLFAIARNVIADALRQRQRLPRTQGVQELQDHPAPASDPLERLRLLEALATLSDPHREVVEAVLVGGVSYHDLSESTGVPPATLRTRAYHALRAMRRHLEGREDDDGHAR